MRHRGARSPKTATSCTSPSTRRSPWRSGTGATVCWDNPKRVELINFHDCKRLSPGAWAYYSSGADHELMPHEERAAFGRSRLLPRVLRGVSRADPDTTTTGAPDKLLLVQFSVLCRAFTKRYSSITTSTRATGVSWRTRTYK